MRALLSSVPWSTTNLCHHPYSPCSPHSCHLLLPFLSYSLCSVSSWKRKSGIMTVISKHKCPVKIILISPPLPITSSKLRLFSPLYKKTGSIWNNTVSALYLDGPWLQSHNSCWTHTDRQHNGVICWCNREKEHDFPQSAWFWWCLT